jgi:hypothetical protein
MATTQDRDAFSPGAPLAPEAPTSIIETQRIGGTRWQQNKLVEDERRLDAVAKRAANKQMQVAAANPQNFKRGTLDGNGMFVPYEEDDARNVVDRTVPAPHYVDPILGQIESRPANGSDHPAGTHHVVERMTESERARRDAANPLPAEVTVRLSEPFTIIDIRAKLVAHGADLTRGDFLVMPDPTNPLYTIATWKLGR